MERPQILVFEVDQASSAPDRFDIGTGNAAFPFGRERIGLATCRIGSQYLHCVRTGGGWGDAFGSERGAFGRLARESVQEPAEGIARVERRGILPALAERERDVIDGWATQRDLHVVPSGTFPVDIRVERCWLWVAEVPMVVVAAVHEIHSADEGRVIAGSRLVADHDDLLMMAPATTDAIVEKHFPARFVHGAGEQQVLLLRVRGSVGTPHQPANADTLSQPIGEHPGGVGARACESLVGVAFEAG